MNDLTKQETIRYEELKGQVKVWMKDRFAVGEALTEIQSNKLYREEYETFEEFCQEEYGIQRAHAYRLIEFVEIKMSSIGDKITNVAQSRAIGAVPPTQRTAVMAMASSNGSLTAKSIQTASKSVQKTVELDKTGFPIPESIQADWKLAEQVGKDLLHEVSRIKVSLETGKEEDEFMFREVSNTAVTHAMNLYTALKQIVPYAVCTSCQGHNPKKCTLCKGRGFFSQFLFQNAIPAEMKAIRQKAIERKK